MGESDAIADQFDSPNVLGGAPPKSSPWKTSDAASPAPSTGSELWPALADAKQRRKPNGGLGFNSAKPPAAQARVDDDGAHPPTVQPVNADSYLNLSLFCAFVSISMNAGCSCCISLCMLLLLVHIRV